jgi:hypothetical protein
MRALKRATYFYQKMVEHGAIGGLLGLARIEIGEFGGKTNRLQAAHFLRQLQDDEDHAEAARALCERYGLDD